MISDIVGKLQSVPLFEGLTTLELQQLAEGFTKKKYPRGAVIYLQGEPADDFYIVESGLVKFCLAEDNKEIILELFREGDYFGDLALFLHDLCRTANAEVIEPATVYVLPRDHLARFLDAHPQVALKLLANMAERCRKANELIRSVIVCDVRRRIYRLLLRLAGEYGDGRSGANTLTIRLTHQQLASMIGTVRETITKVLLELQEEGLVATSNKFLVLQDLNKLREKIEANE